MVKDCGEMNYKIDGNEIGLFIQIDNNLVHPLEPSNFILDELVNVVFVENNEFAVITDLSVESPNPYTEIWDITKIPAGSKIHDVAEPIINMKVNYYHPIDLILYTLVIVETIWMLAIDIKILLL